MEDLKLIDLGILIDDEDDGDVRKINPLWWCPLELTDECRIIIK